MSTIYLDRDPFAKAVEAALIATRHARNESGGSRLGVHPTAFRMALELRQAIERATGLIVEVEGWQDLIATIKPPFPGDSALGTVLRANASDEK